MNIEIQFWQLVLLLITFFGACAGAGKFLLSQMQSHLDTRFQSVGSRLDKIEEVGREEANQWQRVERELMSLKADLPLQYVRREDYIRGQSVIEAKLDGLAMKIENTQLRNLMKGDGHAH
ncbi:hypothetical protein EGJ23_04330 [Pseudomonas sp. o96-267]|uniref:hypothetical protein n=1 Tax=Pseudomonas sp. o96-267 TaxID=2479853 RepID=UPI000F768D70|nr:hypothetical protein [Pseudomonas sp. o96-267]RRV28613.1 hypothetical protein EGJ23_04330 [Pseudomonas sp. o96-267]